MKIERDEAWWLKKASDEKETVGAASRSKKTLSPIALTDEEKASLRSIVSHRERDLMIHALGLDQAKRPYRNRYVSGGRDDNWEALVSRGLAARPPFDTKTTQVLYAVTDEGIAALGIALMPDDLEPSERYAARDDLPATAPAPEE